MPTITAFSTVTYVLALSSDPLNGPYTKNVTVSTGETLALRLSQLTAGPLSNVSVCFGDGSANQSFSITGGQYISVKKTYTVNGTFTIAVTASTGLAVTTTVNSIVVFVFSPGIFGLFFSAAIHANCYIHNKPLFCNHNLEIILSLFCLF
jgi:hypothetical protein